MLHLLSGLFFVACLIGAAALVGRMIRAEAGSIANALLRERLSPEPARAWAARVRQVAPMRPTSLRVATRQIAA